MDEIYGAYFKVHLQYKGTLENLGTKLTDSSDLPEFRYEKLEDEPYDDVAYAEVLGFEIQLEELKNNTKWPDYQYLLEGITTDTFLEQFEGRMFNISHWMARYIALTCELVTMAENEDKTSGQSFHWNEVTLKTENSLVEARE
jgi:hypothetical protein